MSLLLLGLSILPVIVLMVFIYRKDKYQKEPVKSLAKAFVGGMIAIPIDLVLVALVNSIFRSNTVFYTAFLEAGLPEELSKFLVFMVFIWHDRNFDEYMDGIVYASFIGLGFACVENIMYVFGAAHESLGLGIGTSITRALLSIPAHFLFGVMLGYFLSLAKFKPERRTTLLITGLLLAAASHGLFDWLLMVSSKLGAGLGSILYTFFLIGDLFLWKIGMKYINRQLEYSRVQAEEAKASDMEFQINQLDTGYDSEYKHIDWNAGNR